MACSLRMCLHVYVATQGFVQSMLHPQIVSLIVRWQHLVSKSKAEVAVQLRKRSGQVELCQRLAYTVARPAGERQEPFRPLSTCIFG